MVPKNIVDDEPKHDWIEMAQPYHYNYTNPSILCDLQIIYTCIGFTHKCECMWHQRGMTQLCLMIYVFIYNQGHAD